MTATNKKPKVGPRERFITRFSFILEPEPPSSDLDYMVMKVRVDYSDGGTPKRRSYYKPVPRDHMRSILEYAFDYAREQMLREFRKDME